MPDLAKAALHRSMSHAPATWSASVRVSIVADKMRQAMMEQSVSHAWRSDRYR